MPQVDPLRFSNIPMLPAPPGNPVIADDPFAPLPGPVHFNGQQYDNLPPHIAQQLGALPALPAPRERGRERERRYVLPPLPVSYFKKVIK